jgi:hypothetical protein
LIESKDNPEDINDTPNGEYQTGWDEKVWEGIREFLGCLPVEREDHGKTIYDDGQKCYKDVSYLKDFLFSSRAHTRYLS